jgi:solute carrier family 50 protein (sugar transporter)
MVVAFWVISLLIPCIGLFITWGMWLSPLPAVLQVRRSQKLGTLNPLPYPISMLNCIGWVVYGSMIRNEFVLWGNAPGLLLSTYYLFSCLPYVSKIEREWIEIIIYFAVVFWVMMGFIAGMLFGVSKSQRIAATQFIGYVSCFFALGYYAAGELVLRYYCRICYTYCAMFAVFAVQG